MAGIQSFQIYISALLIAVAAMASTAHSNPQRWKYEGWSKTDFSKSTIDFSEILSGGPPKDGIPSIDKPAFVAARDDTELQSNAPVIGLAINGDARAYPLRVLMWHEIVNDTVGGEPVTVTYCPLCNAAIVFKRTLDGRVLEFGTTGKLRNSDLVMYDRQTQSWWQQFTGEAIVGEMVGKELEILPSRLESFASFRQRHPAGRLLVPNNVRMRNYGRNPYVGYDSTARPFLYRGEMPEGIPPMARVVVVREGARPAAIAMKLVREKTPIDFAGVTLSWQPGQASALDTAEISKGRDVGTIIAQRKTATGVVDVPYDVTFAFVFHAFNKQSKIRTE